MPDGARWNRRGYQRMARVTWAARCLVVDFEDGTSARLEAARLLSRDDGAVDWTRRTWSPYEIAVPGTDEIVVIPWSRIRVLTDAAYASHLCEAAEMEARHVGARLRELRQARGLSIEALAERAGVPSQQLLRMEEGEPTSQSTSTQALLEAMGCSLRDLVADGAIVPTRSGDS
jgi:hypothetical protein